MTIKFGDKELMGTYDEFEELYENLEKIFGIEAVEDMSDPGKLDNLDVEIFFDNTIGEN